MSPQTKREGKKTSLTKQRRQRRRWASPIDVQQPWPPWRWHERGCFSWPQTAGKSRNQQVLFQPCGDATVFSFTGQNSHEPQVSSLSIPVCFSCFLFFFPFSCQKIGKFWNVLCRNWSLFCYRSILKSKSARPLLLPTETKSFNQNIESEQSCIAPKLPLFSVCFSKPLPLLFKHW